MSEETYVIKDLDDYEGLILSHPQKCIISICKHVAELLDMFFGVCIKIYQFSERGDVWGSLLQKMNECGY